MAGFLTAISVVLLFSSAAMAASSTRADLCAPVALTGYAHLLARSNFGWAAEHAAFVVREADGTVKFEAWDSGDEFRAYYFGRIPDGTIAIAHTHPHGESEPSRNDIAEAERIGLPILVVTLGAITMADRDGHVETLLGREWRGGGARR